MMNSDKNTKMGCPGLEPGTRRMKVDEFLLFVNKRNSPLPKPCLQLLLHTAFSMYLFPFFEIIVSNFLTIIKLEFLTQSI